MGRKPKKGYPDFNSNHVKDISIAKSIEAIRHIERNCMIKKGRLQWQIVWNNGTQIRLVVFVL